MAPSFRHPESDHHAKWTRHQTLAGQLAGLMLLAAMAGLGIVFANVMVPPEHLFWKPLHLRDPVGAATKPKVGAADPAACRAILSEGGVFFQDVADQPKAGFCELKSAMVVTGGVASLKPAGAVMTCQQALGYALWMRQVVQPAAEEILGAKVASIQHYGTYSCRRIYGQKAADIALPGPLSPAEPPVSEHASANALDVAGFVLDDGRVIWVERDWPTIGLESHFLHRVRDGGCRVFKTVLSPDYNAAHANHLHLDMGGRPLCA